MKKNLLTILAFASVTGAFAQLPVSTSTLNRTAVIEEFTGIYCGFCPDGHDKSNQIKAANPSQVVLVNVHAGGYANVLGTANGYTTSMLTNGVFVGEPDLTTTEGTSINNMSGMNILGYPAGDVSRVNFGVAAYAQQTVSPFGMAQNRNTWSVTATNSIMNQPSYVNVALQGTVDVTTRVLNVEVQVYYTGNSPVGTNSLTVMLLESKIKGPQHNYGTPTLYNAANYDADGSYNHNHALRKTLTPTFGMTIPNTTAGSTFTTMLTYTIPATYGASGKQNFCMLGNLELAAFVTETDRPVISGANGPIVMTNFPNSLDITTTNLANTTRNLLCSGNGFTSSFRFSNLGSSTVTSATFTYAINGGTASVINWTGSVNPQTQSYIINIPTQNISAQASNSLSVGVVSVNATTDQVASNNVITNNNIAVTPFNAAGETMQMDFTQDRWGTDCQWTVYDEVTNAIIATDGPWTDLAANGTLLHTKIFTVTPSTCYKLVVTDVSGDGINGGYGAGNFVVKSGGATLMTSSGQYGSGVSATYKTAASLLTGVKGSALNVSNIELFPNPTSGVTTLNIDLSQSENVNVSVLNSIGQEVYNYKANTLSSGLNTISINTENWASGMYFVNINTPNGSMTKKLNVIK